MKEDAPNPGQLRVKGNALVSTYKAFQKLYGAERAQLVASKLPPGEFASGYPDKLFRTNWYPFSTMVEVWSAFEQLQGSGNGDVVRKVACGCADEDLNTVLKIFLATFGHPRMIAERSALVWRSYYDAGQLVLTKSEPLSLTLELRDFPAPHRFLCASLLGWAEGAYQKTRAKIVQATHPRCRLNGAPVCEYVYRWTE